MLVNQHRSVSPKSTKLLPNEMIQKLGTVEMVSRIPLPGYTNMESLALVLVPTSA